MPIACFSPCRMLIAIGRFTNWHWIPRHRGPAPTPTAHPRLISGRPQLRRLLPARRRDRLPFHRAAPGRAVQRRRDRRHAVPDGRRRQQHPPALLRPGPRLVPHRAQRRPRALPALGIHRHAARLEPRAVPHEPRRHRPDGVLRRNSYWPNAIFYARPIPDHPTKVVGIVTGHHVGRVGELVVFDPAKGRHEADGVVQRIPGYGQKVEPIIEDKLTEHSWPKFLHPYPLEREVLPRLPASPTPDALWGIYLVDVFDNMVLLKEEEGYALLEPIPLRKTPTPPVIPDRSTRRSKDAMVYMADVYSGPGLQGRAARHGEEAAALHLSLRLPAASRASTTAWASTGPGTSKRDPGHGAGRGRRLGHVPRPGQHAHLGAAARRRGQGRAADAELDDGHARRDALLRRLPRRPQQRRRRAPAGASPLAKPPREITPWYGPARGFSFAREVQPVLDRYCVGCHDGQPRARRPQSLTCAATKAASWSIAPANSTATFIRGVTGRNSSANTAACSIPATSRCELRARGRPGERPAPAAADGVPRRHQRAGPDAEQGPPQRQARRRGLGPAGHLDRPERALPRHLGRDNQDPRRPDQRAGSSCAGSTAASSRTTTRCSDVAIARARSR